MKNITWNLDKDNLLREDSSRGGIGFEDCVIALEEGRVLYPSEIILSFMYIFEKTIIYV